MMDLGFGGFLEKFEAHFGSALTKALLIVIGLTVATLCGSVIWTYLLLPIAQLLPDPKSGPAYEFLKLILILAFFLMILNQVLSTFDNYVKRGLRKRLREKVERAERLFEETQELHEQTKEFNRQIEDHHAAARLLLDEAMTTALERGLITPEQASELRGLTDSPSDLPEAEA